MQTHQLGRHGRRQLNWVRFVSQGEDLCNFIKTGDHCLANGDTLAF